MRAVYDKRRKLMVELMREVGFGIPVMPQGAFYVFADASKWTADSHQFALEFLESRRRRGAGRGLRPDGDAGSEMARMVGATQVRLSIIAGC